MTVRFYVTSAALMIFSWLATTFLRDVPMESYPRPPAVASVPPADDASGNTAPPAVGNARTTPVHFISTATP